MPKVKLGIVGCGGVYRGLFGPIMKLLDNCELTALMDVNAAALESAKGLFETRPLQTFTDFDEFLQKADIQAVLIGSPVYHHAEQAIKAAKAGKHIFCEKPMARTLEECDRMIAAAREANVKFMIGFMKRFDKSMKYAKKLIEDGELGIVHQTRCDWSWPSFSIGGWRDALECWGGLFQDHGSHTIDLCRWWMGEIESVSGEISIWLKGRGVEDQAIALCRHQNGGVSIHHQTRLTHKPLIEYYLIDGSKGSLEIQFGPEWSCRSVRPFKMTLYKNGEAIDVTQHQQGSDDEELRQYGRYKLELEHFCQCILEDKPCLNPPEQGRKAIEVINAVYFSSFKREKVKLPFKETFNLEEMFRQLQKEGWKIPPVTTDSTR